MRYKSMAIQLPQSQVHSLMNIILNSAAQYGIVMEAFDTKIVIPNKTSEAEVIEYGVATRDCRDVWFSYQADKAAWSGIHLNSEKDVEAFLQDQVERMNKLLKMAIREI